MVRIVKVEPDRSVLKEIVCRNCGATLEYVPRDVKSTVHHDYGGGADTYRWIVCPNCNDKVTVTRC